MREKRVAINLLSLTPVVATPGGAGRTTLGSKPVASVTTVSGSGYLRTPGPARPCTREALRFVKQLQLNTLARPALTDPHSERPTHKNTACAALRLGLHR